MEFEDKEKYWDILFSFDMLLWIVSLFITLFIQKNKNNLLPPHIFLLILLRGKSG